MRRVAVKVLAAGSAALLFGVSGLAAQEPHLAADEAAFAEDLRECVASRFEVQHPLIPDFTIEHTVDGLRNARCLYEQTVPGEMRMICEFTEVGRTAMAGEIESPDQTPSMSISVGSQPPAWARECAIVLPEGGR